MRHTRQSPQPAAFRALSLHWLCIQALPGLLPRLESTAIKNLYLLSTLLVPFLSSVVKAFPVRLPAFRCEPATAGGLGETGCRPCVPEVNVLLLQAQLRVPTPARTRHPTAGTAQNSKARSSDCVSITSRFLNQKNKWHFLLLFKKVTYVGSLKTNKQEMRFSLN